MTPSTTVPAAVPGAVSAPELRIVLLDCIRLAEASMGRRFTPAEADMVTDAVFDWIARRDAARAAERRH